MKTDSIAPSDFDSSLEDVLFKKYTVSPLRNKEGQWSGYSPDGNPVIVLEVNKCDEREIKLLRLHLMSAVKCEIEVEGLKSQIIACVIECLVSDKESKAFFFTTMERVFQDLDYLPKTEDVHQIIEDTRDIFSKLGTLSLEAVTGLTGELFFILLCVDSASAVKAWHVNSSDIMDFTFKTTQVEVKATYLTSHRHTIKYEQLSHPNGTPAFLVSFLFQESENGVTINEIKEHLEAKLKGNHLALKKLREMYAKVVGVQPESLPRYDTNYILRNARVYRIDDVPGIRGELPYGCNHVKFESLLDVNTGIPVVGKQTNYAGMPNLIRNFFNIKI